jgi:hypothetical protein
MEAGTDELRRIGHLRLSRGGRPQATPGVVDLELGPAGERFDEWQRAGGLLGLQALAPAAGLPADQRARMSVLAAGAGAALIGYAALALGARDVEVVLHPEDHEAFEALLDREAKQRATVHRRAEDAAGGALHALAAFGCDGAVPDIALCEPLVRRLRPEGQLLLYGMPTDMLEPVFDELARRGLSLHAMGIDDGQAFLAGSLEGGDLS